VAVQGGRVDIFLFARAQRIDEPRKIVAFAGEFLDQLTVLIEGRLKSKD
jgi:hypothetical protein